MPIEIAIRDAVDEIVVPAYDSTAYTCKVWPWQVVTPGEYGDAWSPTHPSGRQTATEARSRLVDVIPSVSPTYSPRGRVEETYGQMLRSAHAKVTEAKKNAAESSYSAADVDVIAPVRTTSASVMRKLNAEMSQRVEVIVSAADGAVVKALDMTANARAALESARRQADAAALAHATAAIQQRQSGTAPQAAAAAPLRGTLAAVTQIPSADKPVQDEPSSVASALYKALTIFEMSALAMAGNPGMTYHPSYLSPENLTDSDAAASWPLITLPMQDGVSLTLRFTRVDITRPWLLLSLFDLPGWGTDEMPGSLSNGKTDGNDGIFPLLPVSLIVARDIRASRGTDTIFQASGLQVVAWISRVIPFSPH